MRTNVILTAGFDKAKNVLAVAELLKRGGINIRGILVVNPYGIKRAKQLIRQRGKQAIISSFLRLYKSGEKVKDDPVDCFMDHQGISYRSITEWCKQNKINKLTVKSLNEKKSIDFIRENTPDWVIYGGGGILKDDFISAADGKILNAHSGPLPEIRGMNACEWSILLGYDPAVTIHLINRGIDTGGIIKKIPVIKVPGDDTEILRNKCVLAGITGLVDTVLNPPPKLPEPDLKAALHRQCYILAPALKELLEKRLTQ